ncbi:hypothetical protein HMPREF3206_00615 [Fusobacterium equinum]|uniref:Uncharacterized protein n=1 Tax=Fusobacterium equinum TaxID=134605 RepID=A0A133NH44_9FUSO|nr:hypothetical protein HMPREF3206_00615 [Fusobacterium equinum]
MKIQYIFLPLFYFFSLYQICFFFSKNKIKSALFFKKALS